MRFTFIAAKKAEHTVTILCRCLCVTRSGFYAWQARPESLHARNDRRLKVLVHTSFAESRRNYGSPRVHDDLIDWQEHVSRKRVVRLMQEEGLKARVRKRYKPTTMSDHDQPVAANLLDRRFEAAAPNQRWVGDTTECVIATSGKLYLAVILDLFSRFVVGWALSAVNDRHLTIKALEMALKRRCPDFGLLHHSDQGCTYASGDYQDLVWGNKAAEARLGAGRSAAHGPCRESPPSPVFRRPACRPALASADRGSCRWASSAGPAQTCGRLRPEVPTPSLTSALLHEDPAGVGWFGPHF